MDIADFRISSDGENAMVQKVGLNADKGTETLRPVAYVRGVLEALLSVQRKMTVEQLDKAKDMKELIVLITKQQEELIALVKANCKECLN